MNKKTILSGIEPSGNLCIGNYIGALKHWNKLQKDYESVFLVVDMHAITTNQVPSELRKQKRIIKILKFYLNGSKKKSFLH